MFHQAMKERRVLTIHHGESECDAFWGEPEKHAVNVVGFCIFAYRIPDDIVCVIGIDSQLGKIKELTEKLLQ